MKYTLLGNQTDIVYVESEEVLICDTPSALDLMMTILYDYNSTKIILDKHTFSEEFFHLSSGIAGDILQKFINYRTKLAIVGDFSKYTSKPLQDFIYECNNGRDLFFVDNLAQALARLQSI